MTAPEKKKKRMAKTAQPKNVVIDGEAYVKCPYPDCGYMVRDWGYKKQEAGKKLRNSSTIRRLKSVPRNPR
jgi:hypothetical protein